MKPEAINFSLSAFLGHFTPHANSHTAFDNRNPVFVSHKFFSILLVTLVNGLGWNTISPITWICASVDVNV